MTLFATRHRGLAAELERLERSLDSDATVLILGAPGTGKDRLARLLHSRSPRAAEPFVRIDLASLSDDLFDSELFGHERGAFTGAVAGKPGLLEGAAGGTLYLDRIDVLAPRAQGKLLRVLEERVFRRVGGTRENRVDARFVASAAPRPPAPRPRGRVPRRPLLPPRRPHGEAPRPRRAPRRPPSRRPNPPSRGRRASLLHPGRREGPPRPPVPGRLPRARERRPAGRPGGERPRSRRRRRASTSASSRRPTPRPSSRPPPAPTGLSAVSPTPTSPSSSPRPAGTSPKPPGASESPARPSTPA